jgi:hypothetical protein
MVARRLYGTAVSSERSYLSSDTYFWLAVQNRSRSEEVGWFWHWLVSCHVCEGAL